MDRVICGDVGYGKTEIGCARRSKRFKTANRSRAGAHHLLADQHLQTFRDRMAGFPVTVKACPGSPTPPSPAP